VKAQLSAEAVEFGRNVQAAIRELGGIDAVRKADERPAARATEVERVLKSLGMWDLRPLNDQVELEAAAAACRGAGWHALAYPLAERLAAPPEAEALMVVGPGRSVAPHADLPLRWAAVDPRGNRLTVLRTGPLLLTNLGPFVAEVEVEPRAETLPRDTALVLNLQIWWLTGLLERCVAMTRQHMTERHQFGRSLAVNQGLQFMVTEAVVAVRGVVELAKHTSWSISRVDRERHWLVDATGLRLAGLEAAETVLRIAHQIHGAIGFCHEHDLSWLSRLSQSVRRLPLSKSQTEELLLEMMTEVGYDGIFPLEAD